VRRVSSTLGIQQTIPPRNFSRRLLKKAEKGQKKVGKFLVAGRKFFIMGLFFRQIFTMEFFQEV